MPKVFRVAVLSLTLCALACAEKKKEAEVVIPDAPANPLPTDAKGKVVLPKPPTMKAEP
jgi:hypothetical protein